MIAKEIKKIEFRGSHFDVHFTIECTACKRVAPVKKITGNVLTNLVAECRKCGDLCSYDLTELILDTCKNTWNFNQDDMNTVTSGLEFYKKR